MQMTESEIVRDYREAKNKREQVTILADRNVCEKEEIIGILLKNGVDPRELPRKRKPKEKSGETTEKKHCAADTVASILAREVMQIDQMLQEHYAVIKRLEQEKEDIKAYIDTLA